MKKLILFLMIVGVAFGATLLSGSPRANANASIQSGDLIRGETFSAVYYYGADGFRYVFPNSKTYFTWYDNFDNVIVIPDSQLGTIQIGGNVRYRGAARMIKINTDPRTYAVAPGAILRHVTSEAVASALYGSNWNQMIDDVPDAFFTNYTVGDPISEVDDYTLQALNADSRNISINNNRGLVAPEEISITNSAYSPISVTIEPGQTVRFTNNGTESHTATSDDLTWGSGTMMPGRSFVRKFEEAGTYTFFDSYNSQLTGAIFVQ